MTLNFSNWFTVTLTELRIKFEEIAKQLQDKRYANIKVTEKSCNFDANDERTNYNCRSFHCRIFIWFIACRLNVQGRWWIIDWKLRGTDYRAPRSLISVPSRQFARMVLHQTGDIKTRNSVARIMQDDLYLEWRENISNGRDRARHGILNDKKFMNYGFSTRINFEINQL